MLNTTKAPNGVAKTELAARSGRAGRERTSARSQRPAQAQRQSEPERHPGRTEHDERWRDDDEQHVLRHVRPEQLIGGAVERARERDDDDHEAGDERGRAQEGDALVARPCRSLYGASQPEGVERCREHRQQARQVVGAHQAM